MEKINHLLGHLEYKDLLDLKQDLDAGSYLLHHAVNKKLNDIELSHRKVCACCEKELEKEVDDVYTLLFGEQTIRKKASFCGLDCLQHFLYSLNQSKRLSLKKEV